MIIDHIGIPVSNVKTSKAFYVEALKPLGIGVIMEVMGHVGMGEDRPQFWFGESGEEIARNHICFSAKSRAQVRAFYEAALKAGGKDNGEPGLRPHYHADYYGAFILDPDGYNIEAVCHAPE